MARFMNTVAALLLTAQVYSRVLDNKLYSRANTCPSYDVVSCTDSVSGLDKCCAPDQGHFVLAIQWLPSYCKNVGGNKECKPQVLENVAKDTWTLHGLWPGNCDGVTYVANCNPDREVENIEEVIQSRDEELLGEMKKLWGSGNPDKDNNWFWAHEWNKHGQCVSTITPECLGDKYKENDDIITYFEKALEIRKEYDLFPILDEANIVPDDNEGYPIDTIQKAIGSHYNNAQVEINCVYNKAERKQYLSEVRLCFHAKNQLELEGPISCPKSSSRCDVKKPIFYAVNHATDKPEEPKTTTTTTTTKAPEPTTTVAEETTKAPEPTTTKVEETTKAPEPTTTKVEETTKAPEPTTTKVEETTKAPEPTTTVAEETTKAPEPTTTVAEETTKALEPTTTVAEEPTTTAAEETTKAPEPITTAAEETTDAPEPTEETDDSSDEEVEEINGEGETVEAEDDDSDIEEESEKAEEEKEEKEEEKKEAKTEKAHRRCHVRKSA